MEPVTGQLQREHSARATRTYSAAADLYLRPALGFWDRWGAATVARLPLSSGGAVLDVCCGAGRPRSPPRGRSVRQEACLASTSPSRCWRWQGSEPRTWTSAMFHFGKATRQRPGLGAAPSTLSCVSSACSSPPTCLRSWPRCGGSSGPVGPLRSLPGDPTGPNRRRASSGARFESSSRRCSGRSTHGTRSPRRPRWPTCSRAAVSETRRSRPPRASTTNLSGLTTFWEIVLGSGYRGTVDALGDEQRQWLRERVVGALRSRGITRLRNDVVFGSAGKR